MAKGRIYLLLGAVLALISGALVYITVQSARPKPIQTRAVLVASQVIPPRTFVTADNSKVLFSVVNWPVDIIPANALSSPTQAFDHVVTGDIEKGAPVFSTNLSVTKTDGQNGLSIDIPQDEVAIAVPVTQTDTAGGVIAPGDFVDVLVSVNAGPSADASASGAAASNGNEKKLVSLTTLQHVKVLAIGQSLLPPGAQPASGKDAASNNSTPPVGPTMTLLLNHQDALLVKYAKDSGGMIDLVLRRYDDKDTASTDPVDLNYFLNKFGYHLVAPNTTTTPAKPAK